ncbi:MAG: class I SAM-dependent methyltransferase [Oryzomonas sp.]|uniref:class I SAM-dependent methyltransferase n=1 Tax=Oryzomonas sp. TaxID=2855186 RepID=UPI0028434245|nr:class I SAM-dependent methyltransferase [Oryzomonas sp.]MDR3580302.1 class I SAM-dependent methyltransferase [Oryzomonas sp.]
MIRFTPSLDPEDARFRLERLIPPYIDPSRFQSPIRRLRRMSAAFAAFCPPPWPSFGLCLTPETHYQSELWFPLAELQPIFDRFRRVALGYPPLPGSEPFSEASSWAGVAAVLPPPLSSCPTPARLLQRLLSDSRAREKYLFWSCMPNRFYGEAMDRYPRQTALIRQWLQQRQTGEQTVRCLDAACGDGAVTYGLARLLLNHGFTHECFRVEGWTIDPLEVWAAAHCTLPHDPLRQEVLRHWTAPVFANGAERSLSFRQADLLTMPPDRQHFDLIVCNGLLGGPLINEREEIGRIVNNLAALLRPGGLVLATDRFHGGWKQKCPHHEVQALFASAGLAPFEAGEGVGGLKQGYINC